MADEDQGEEPAGDSAADAAPLTGDEKRAIIRDFESNGFATFVLGADREAFDVLMDYIRQNQVTTLTDVDRSAGTVTITKRPFGSLEFGL